MIAYLGRFEYTIDVYYIWSIYSNDDDKSLYTVESLVQKRDALTHLLVIFLNKFQYIEKLPLIKVLDYNVSSLRLRICTGCP